MFGFKQLTYAYMLLFSAGTITYCPLFSQSDTTIQLKTFEVVSKVSIPEIFKQQSVDSSFIHALNGIQMGELLKFCSPLFIKEYAPMGLASLSFRGTGSNHAQILWNGIPINNPMLGMMDLNTIGVNSRDQVEIDYGAASMFSGTGGLGGSIRTSPVITKEDSFYVDLTQKLSSWRQLYSSAVLGFKIGKTRHRTSAVVSSGNLNYPYTNYAAQDYPKENLKNAEYNTQSLNHDAIFFINNHSNLELHLNGFDIQRNAPASLSNPNTKEFQRDVGGRYSAGFTHEKGKHLVKITSGGQTGNIAWTDSLKHLSFNNKYSNEFGSAEHRYSSNKITFTNQIQVSRESGESESYSGVNSRIIPSWTASFKFMPSKRFGYHTGNKMTLYHSDLMNAPYAGMSCHLKNTDLRLQVSGHSQVPTLNQIFWYPGGNPELLAEYGKSIEAGMKHKFSMMGMNTQMGLTTYKSEITNWILWQPDTLNSSWWSAYNLKKVELSGLEANVKMFIAKKKWSFKTAMFYNYSLSQNLETNDKETSTVKRQLIFEPLNTGKVSAILSFRNYQINYFQEFIGRRFITTSNDTWLPPYTVANLGFSYQMMIFRCNAEFGLGLKNIWNEEYHAMPWRPMPPRYWSAHLNLSF